MSSEDRPRNFLEQNIRECYWAALDFLRMADAYCDIANTLGFEDRNFRAYTTDIIAECVDRGRLYGGSWEDEPCDENTYMDMKSSITAMEVSEDIKEEVIKTLTDWYQDAQTRSKPDY